MSLITEVLELRSAELVILKLHLFVRKRLRFLIFLVYLAPLVISVYNINKTNSIQLN